MGVSFTLRDREVSDVQIYENQSFGDLRQNFEDIPYGVTLDNSSGYLFNLTFPFSGRRKIGMVIKAEMDELLPFPTEDMVIDFKETRQGTVLAAAIHKMVAVEANGNKRVRYVGIQSLSALYALRWAGHIPAKDFVFVHCSKDAVVILGMKDGHSSYLRQFVFSQNDASFDEALGEILNEPGYRPAMCILVSDSEDRANWKELIEKKHNIHVHMPSLHDSIGTSSLPKWLWSGFGAALIALSPKGDVNLAAEKPAALPGMNRMAFYLAGCLAGLSVVAWGLLYLNFSLKQDAYDYLDSQPTRIYKSLFPKSPQARDIQRAFQEKIKNLERQSPAGVNGTSAMELLNELSSKIDPQIDVKVTDFIIDDKEFAFSGTTVSFAALEKIKNAVEKLKGVANVDLQNVDLAPNRQVRFKIRGKL